MHGKMHVPRYHGRLYPGWRLPLIPNLDDLNTRFNSVLEKHIEHSFKLMFSRHGKTVYPDPNESTLLTLPLSASTLSTPSLVEVVGREKGATDMQGLNRVAEIGEHSLSPEAGSLAELPGNLKGSSSVSGLRNRIQAEEISESISALHDQPATRSSSQNSSGSTRSHDTTADAARLIQGVPLISDISILRRPKFHTTGVLDIHIEYTAEAGTSTDGSYTETSYGIEWLSAEMAKELRGDDVAVVLDVEALRSQIVRKLGERNDLLIMAGGVLVRIAF